MPFRSDPAVGALKPPFYLIDLDRLRANMEQAVVLREEAGCQIVLALKAFSSPGALPLMAQYLDGVSASSVFEARLAEPTFGKRIHAYCPAYTEDSFAGLLPRCSHMIFNSIGQWRRFREEAVTSGVQGAIRLNPELSLAPHAMYDPSAAGSRLGVTRSQWIAAGPDVLTGLTGVHLHNLCEQGAAELSVTVAALEEKFADVLERVSWINLGGGQFFAR